MTPLAAAIEIRHIALAGRLIRSGANPFDSLALEKATTDFGLLQILLTALDGWGMTDDSKDVGHTALHKATWTQDQTTIVPLLDALLKYNKRTDRILSAALLGALERNTGANCPIFRTVLGRGADPDTVFEFGNDTTDIPHWPYLRTALCVAISGGPGKVRELLEAGANPEKI
jgi:ankyrin repeat protein